MISRASRNAKRLRAQQDFQTISAALEMYKQDHGDYPRTEGIANVGFAVLGKALIGPYGDGLLPGGGADAADPPQHQTAKPYASGESTRTGPNPPFYVTLNDAPANTSATSGYYYAYFDPHDGHDGPGFKTRPGAAQVFGPYLAPGKVKSRGVALLDPNERPILYFPARPGKPNINVLTPYGPYVGRDVRSLFNANDNFEMFHHKETDSDSDVLNRIRVMFGDLNYNGVIDAGETAIDKPYVLISAGADGVFGPVGWDSAAPAEDTRRAVEKCDDASNVQ
jgi:hypothetical protein